MASAAAATGRLPVRLLLYNQLEELRNHEWTGLLSIAVDLGTSVTNVYWTLYSDHTGGSK